MYDVKLKEYTNMWGYAVLSTTTWRLSGDSASEHTGYGVEETGLSRPDWSDDQDLGLCYLNASWWRETVDFWLQVLQKL